MNSKNSDDEEPAPSEAALPAGGIDRRKFLRAAGLGVGTLAVAGAAGLSWRAIDGGIFASGTGAAYAAWAQAAPQTTDSLSLVRAAVLAANAHNAQPWQFRVTADRIDLFADTDRNLGTMDPLRREMDVSLGCALENLVLAGAPIGLIPTVTLLPDRADPTHIARVDLVKGNLPVSPLFAAIARRHTHRAGYDTERSVTRSQLDELGALNDDAGIRVLWFTSPADKAAFGSLTIRATEAIISDPRQAADDAAWYRSDWHEIQKRKDGITIDASGQAPFIRAFAKLVPISQAQNNDGWFAATKQSQIPTAAAFGALVVPDSGDTVHRLNVGRLWQRMHLSATTTGLALQPLCQVPERIDRESSAGLAPDFSARMAELLPVDGHAVMTFRIGYPTTEALPSPRRPASEVVFS